MSVIDQAFVKAYTRRVKPDEASSGSGTPASPQQVPPDVSINPRSEKSAMVWVDAVADQFLRHDHAHRAAPPAPQAAVAGQPPAPPCPAAGDAVAIGLGQAVPPCPAPVQQQPVGTSPVELPWDDSSSVLAISAAVDAAPLYYQEAVIVQESYWPAVTSQPLDPPAPSTQPAPQAASAPQAAAAPSVSPGLSAPSESALQPASVEQTPPVVQPDQGQAELSDGTAALSPPAFTPVWEVDGFEFSETVQRLFSDPALVRSIAAPLDRASSEGLQTMLVTSLRRGDGRTTVATGMAMAAATAGLRVALVDATALSPQRADGVAASPAGATLADSLNLEPQSGWLDALRSGNAIAEAAVHSIDDQITVFPLSLLSPVLTLGSDEFRSLLQTLRGGFDLIVIDGPPCTDGNFGALVAGGQGSPGPVSSVGQRGQATRPIDAAVLVQNCRHSDHQQINLAIDLLRRDGIAGLGLVQNFL